MSGNGHRAATAGSSDLTAPDRMQHPTASRHRHVVAAQQRTGGLLEQAEAVLQRTCAANPHDVKALLRLGDVQRGKGEFPAALRTYRRLRAQDPDHATAAWLISILSGGRVRFAAPPGCRPVPFVRLTNFLTSAQHARLCTQVLAGRERFVPAQVGDGREKDSAVKRGTRIALVADRRTRRAVRSWFGPKLRSVLPHVLARLRMESLHPFRIEMDVTVHLGGGFYKVHRDNTEGRARPRQLSYVYYFHPRPKPFTGGDLRLYDTDFEAGRASPAVFSRIEPVDNSLVFFPSGAFHEITPVACDLQDFGSGRFTVNGWVRSRDEDEHETPRHADGQGDNRPGSSATLGST